MFHTFRKLSLALVVCLFGSTIALATPVSYYTVGVFSGSGATISNASNTGPGESSATVQTCIFGCTNTVLSFTGTGESGVTPPASIALGDFAESIGFYGGNFSGVGFDLNVYQTNPSSGQSAFAGALSGYLTWLPALDTLAWTPSNDSFSLTGGGVTDTYTLNNLDRDGDYDLCSNDVTASLTQTIAPTPEPPTLLLLGTGLIALFGALKLRRRTIA